jgi:hypothetical protein
MKAGLVDDRPDPRERLLALVGHAEPEHGHRSSRWPGQAEQQSNDRRLAGAVGPEKAEGDPAWDL